MSHSTDRFRHKRQRHLPSRRDHTDRANAARRRAAFRAICRAACVRTLPAPLGEVELDRWCSSEIRLADRIRRCSAGVCSIKELLDERVQLRRFEHIDLDDRGRMSFPGSPDLPSQSRHDAFGDHVLSRVEGQFRTFARRTAANRRDECANSTNTSSRRSSTSSAVNNANSSLEASSSAARFFLAVASACRSAATALPNPPIRWRIRRDPEDSKAASRDPRLELGCQTIVGAVPAQFVRTRESPCRSVSTAVRVDRGSHG